LPTIRCLDRASAAATRLTAAGEALGYPALDELAGAELAHYRAQVLGDGRGPASHSQALAALRAFLTWAGTFGAHELAAGVFAAAATLRDRALLGAGLRVAEAAALDVGDLLEDGQGGALLAVRSGKGSRSREVPIRCELEDLLRLYFDETGRALGEAGPLFRAHDRGARARARRRLTAGAIRDAVAVAARRAGIRAKRVTPHSLRHTYALAALRRGGNVVAVAKLLGHRHIATTQRCVAHLELSDLRATVPPLPSCGPSRQRVERGRGADRRLGTPLPALKPVRTVRFFAARGTQPPGRIARGCASPGAGGQASWCR
jgi:integrase